MRRVVNDAMDVQGGAGICLGPRNFMGRVYQALPISITVEGREHFDAHAHRLRPGCGALPSLYPARDARGDRCGQRTRIENFDDAIFSHVGYTFSECRARAVASASPARASCRCRSRPDAALCPAHHAPEHRARAHRRRRHAHPRWRSQALREALGPVCRRAEFSLSRLGGDQAFRGAGSPAGGRAAAAPLGLRLCLHQAEKALVVILKNLPSRFRLAAGRLVFPRRAPLPSVKRRLRPRGRRYPARAFGGA